MNREEIIEEIKKYCPIENNRLEWGDICFFTKFDSFATAFALGLIWPNDLDEITTKELNVLLFNLINFPNTDPNDNSRKAGYGKTQERIDFLTNYKPI